ncbi:hypothetical protein D920_02209 [Enterococcus faecalis 13-SD-W-01]|nr:hypothetical protein D920_02209 [Enterococcus faecalis 13-SD-W-01]
MKKRIVLPFIAISFLLAGCGKQSASDKSSTAFSETNTSSKAVVSKETSERQTSDTLKEPEKIEASKDDDDQLSSFEESQKLKEVLDGADDLNVKTLSENQNKRVLLLFDEEQTKKYKSIFIKNTQRLKVIDEISGDLLFDSKV